MHLAFWPRISVQASDRHKEVLGHLMFVAQKLACQGEGKCPNTVVTMSISASHPHSRPSVVILFPIQGLTPSHPCVRQRVWKKGSGWLSTTAKTAVSDNNNKNIITIQNNKCHDTIGAVIRLVYK